MRRLVLGAAALVAVSACAAPSNGRAGRPAAGDEAPVARATSGVSVGDWTRPFSRPLSLEDCLRLAEANAPTAESFRARLDAARALVVTAETWPNPSVNYLAQDIGVVDDQGRRVLVQQELLGYRLLFAWTRGLEVDVARARQAHAEASVDEDRRRLRFEVGRAFYDLLAQEEVLALEDEAVVVAAELAATAERRLAAGDVSPLDGERARAEALEARAARDRIRRVKTLDRLAFSLALGAERPVAVALTAGWPEGLPASLAHEGTAGVASDVVVARLVDRATALRPDVRRALAAVRSGEASVELEDRRVLPLSDVTVQAGARESQNGVGGVVTVNVPLPLFDRNQGARSRARAELADALAEVERLRRLTALEVESAFLGWHEARTIRDELRRPIMTLRRKSLETARRLYDAGEIAYQEVLLTERDSVFARRELVQAEREVALERWRLLVAAGGP